MMYYVTFRSGHEWSEVYDFYFTTKKEAVAFIKGLPDVALRVQFDIEDTWDPEGEEVTLTKINLPKTQKEWAWTLTHLASTAHGVYEGVNWFGREVSMQTWTYEDGKWSVEEVING